MGNRTVVVFTDLPRHIEFRSFSWPLLRVNEEVHIDDLELKNPFDLTKKRKISGVYRISACKYKFSAKKMDGFTQFLELTPV
jgi:hypothetical protein